MPHVAVGASEDRAVELRAAAQSPGSPVVRSPGSPSVPLLGHMGPLSLNSVPVQYLGAFALPPEPSFPKEAEPQLPAPDLFLSSDSAPSWVPGAACDSLWVQA